jgi:hypothetical protein
VADPAPPQGPGPPLGRESRHRTTHIGRLGRHSLARRGPERHVQTEAGHLGGDPPEDPSNKMGDPPWGTHRGGPTNFARGIIAGSPARGKRIRLGETNQPIWYMGPG